MSKLTEAEAPWRRRDALNILLQTRGNVCSELSLRNMLRRIHGYTLPAETMRSDIRWLADAGLVKVHDAESVLFATLLERGRDVAQGDLQIEGVEAPDVARE